ncbi:hypothetical protein HNQ94_000423 [Salirhabdus euzebyi]|uniref:Replication terminator protein n=1 Tax=Salirhabdus euzebyi TaxID=394506 RepID=A0A841Q1L0_9BACI|nr:replication terminator protein [Salirhabdus euzebyi]MBB6452002.1 hypothetical protein [Salirhabdus euzebyi]
MEYMIDLNEFADGALAWRVNEELQRIFENIADPNTDPKKNRTLTITIKIHGDEKRDVLQSNIQAKSKLVPAKDVETKLIMGADKQGNIFGQELRSGAKGQLFMDHDGDVSNDVGEKVLSFRNQKAGGEKND